MAPSSPHRRWLTGRVTTRFFPADSDDAARVVHYLQLRCARGGLGVVSRPERMARPSLVDLPLTRQGREPLQVLLASVDGRPAGYALFSRKEKWKDSRARGTVNVRELAATDAATLLAPDRRLGSRSLATQADLGVVAELTPGSLRPVSRAMSCDREPAGAIDC